jgi:hypothetical protein
MIGAIFSRVAEAALATYLDQGVDYSYARPRPSGLYAAGYRFVARYLAPQSDKRLTATERDALWNAGLGIYLVWENSAGDMLDGAAGGRADATEARRQAHALGFPADYPIFHAADEDYSTSQLAGPITAYSKAAAAVHGGIQHYGVYGGIRTIRYVADHHLAGFFWQTYAWSAGQWDSRAQLQQYHNGVVVAGGEVDLCRSTTDKGRWTMPLSSADKAFINKAISDAITAALPSIANQVWHSAQLSGATVTQRVSASSGVETARNNAISANNGVAQLLAQSGLAPTVVTQRAGDDEPATSTEA